MGGGGVYKLVWGLDCGWADVGTRGVIRSYELFRNGGTVAFTATGDCL